MIFSRTFTAVAAAVGLALAGPASVALAQEGKAQAQAELSAQKVEAFALAAFEVAQIQQKYRPEYQAAQTDAEKRALVEKVNEEMRLAVKATDGISVEEYIAIGRTASQDEDLSKKITARIQALMAEAQ